MPKTKSRNPRFDLLAWSLKGVLRVWGEERVDLETARLRSVEKPDVYISAFPRERGPNGPHWFFRGDKISRKRLPFSILGLCSEVEQDGRRRVRAKTADAAG